MECRSKQYKHLWKQIPQIDNTDKKSCAKEKEIEFRNKM